MTSLCPSFPTAPLKSCWQEEAGRPLVLSVHQPFPPYFDMLPRTTLMLLMAKGCSGLQANIPGKLENKLANLNDRNAFFFFNGTRENKVKIQISFWSWIATTKIPTQYSSDFPTYIFWKRGKSFAFYIDKVGDFPTYRLSRVRNKCTLYIIQNIM